MRVMTICPHTGLFARMNEWMNAGMNECMMRAWACVFVYVYSFSNHIMCGVCVYIHIMASVEWVVVKVVATARARYIWSAAPTELRPFNSTTPHLGINNNRITTNAVLSMRYVHLQPFSGRAVASRARAICCLSSRARRVLHQSHLAARGVWMYVCMMVVPSQMYPSISKR